MRVLALDLSASNTGWAFGSPGDKPLSGAIRFAPKGATEDEVWFAALKWLNDQIGMLSPEVVAVEAAIFSQMGGQSNPKTMAMLIGLQAVVRTVVKARLPGRAKLIPSSSARKFFTGRGVFPMGEAKPAVLARCIQLGWLDAGASFDTADALCVWAKACADIDPAFAASFTELGTA